MIRILLIALLLVGCDKLEQEKTRTELADEEWDKAEMIDFRYYKNPGDPRFVETFEMDGYKFVIFFNNRGSAMVAIPLNNDTEYIRSLEEENQLLGSKLAEYALD